MNSCRDKSHTFATQGCRSCAGGTSPGDPRRDEHSPGRTRQKRRDKDRHLGGVFEERLSRAPPGHPRLREHGPRTELAERPQPGTPPPRPDHGPLASRCAPARVALRGRARLRPARWPGGGSAGGPRARPARRAGLDGVGPSPPSCPDSRLANALPAPTTAAHGAPRAPARACPGAWPGL